MWTSAFERKITLEIRVIEGVSEISTLFWMNIDSVIQGEKLFGISSIIASGTGRGRIWLYEIHLQPCCNVAVFKVCAGIINFYRII